MKYDMKYEMKYDMKYEMNMNRLGGDQAHHLQVYSYMHIR